jgi:hypothetical protein
MRQKKLAIILFIVSVGILFLANRFAAIWRTGNMRPLIVAYAQGGGTTIFLPSIMKYPTVTTSHYWVVSNPNFNPYTLGQADAQVHQSIIQYGNRIIFLISLGQPCQTGGAYGSYSYDQNNNCHSTSEFLTHIQNYLSGYCAMMQSILPGTSGQNCGYRYNLSAVPVIFAFGPNNCGSLHCDPNNPPNTVTYANGQAWGTLIENVNSYVVTHGYSYQIFVAGAMDIEGGYNTYANTRAWLDGLLNTAPYKPFYDYGNCDCPDTYNPNGSFRHDWSCSKTYEVSFSIGFSGDVIPEIYHTNGVDATRWQGVSKWAVNNGHGMAIFRQLLTECGACGQTQNCNGIDDVPMNAFDQLQKALNADPQTTGGLSTDFRLTDIKYYP